jgi:phospholipid/cholesterol/gamma-HCH transport system ATP-binding protein
MTGTPKIELRAVHKAFGAKVVLDGVDLKIEPGSSTVIIGGSGTGKSVTLKCILGLMAADAGEILFEGTPLTRRSRRGLNFYGRIGMLFQGSALFDSLPVWENVGFGLMQGHGLSRAEARKVAVEKLARVGLDEQVADLSPSELSGGMQKRVGLARAIAANPEVIFFDEPTTGLDPIMADVINQLIKELVRDIGATAVSITHDMASTRKIADSVAMIYHGRIIWQGPAETIRKSGNDHVDQFVNGRAKGPIRVGVLDE